MFFKNFIKNKYCLLIFLFFSFELSAQNLIFDNYQTLSSGSEGFGRPRVALLSNDTPIVVFRKNSTPKTLRMVKWNGSSFTSPTDIVSQNIIPSSQDGPEIATKGDTIYVVFTSNFPIHPSIFMIKSFDGGISFTDTVRVSENQPPQICRMSNISIDNSGNPIVSYMKYDLNFSNPKQMVRTSNDYGVTFNSAVNASINASADPCECCKSSLVVDDANIFLLFRKNDNNIRNSHVAKSDNFGISFDLVNDVDDYDWVLSSCPTSVSKGVVFDDSLLIVKKSGATGNNEVVLTSVAKSNLEYSYNRNIDFIPNVIQRNPEISNNKDSIFIVWEDNRTGFYDCYLSYSLNGVANISNGIRFTDTLTFGSKYLPHLVFNKGNVHLVYVDDLDNSIKYVRAYFSNTTNIFELVESKNRKLNFDILGRKNINSKLNYLIKK